LPEPKSEEPVLDLGVETSVRHVVIIGNGAAGVTAADEIRRLSPSCAIDIVAREKDHFYNRMAIARLLYGRTAMAGMSLQEPNWAEKKNATVWLNTTAVSIDRAAHEIKLGTGEKLRYDKLILAQGSRAVMPPIPGNDLPGCFVLRDAEGAMAIRAWRQENGCRRAVVVGGGVLGIEAADALRQLNLDVTILQRSSRLMDRQLDDTGSAILRRYLEGLGMTVVTEAILEGCYGEDRLAGVTLAGGQTIEADILIACAGIQPNVEIARDAGIEVNRGVKVDRAMRTSDPDIFAIGDVAELPGSISGLWAVSTAQARVAAAAVFGRDALYSDPNTLVSLKME
jgi:NAD(P)H-nitrite reductase large subunit